jgi:hypothetical protein
MILVGRCCGLFQSVQFSWIAGTIPYPVDLLFRAVIAEQQGDYRDLFQSYYVTCALVRVQKPIYPALRKDTAWRESYRDRDVAVLRRANETAPAP